MLPPLVFASIYGVAVCVCAVKYYKVAVCVLCRKERERPSVYERIEERVTCACVKAIEAIMCK